MNFQNFTSFWFSATKISHYLNSNKITYNSNHQTLADNKIKQREIRSLESIKDNYEKIILTMDKTINKDFNGIKVINIIDWLLKEE